MFIVVCSGYEATASAPINYSMSDNQADYGLAMTAVPPPLPQSMFDGPGKPSNKR